MKDVISRIYDYSLEEIMGDRFGRYSKYIIQDRAIPDVRDGLKPVQRRILFSMYKEKNTFDKPLQSTNGISFEFELFDILKMLCYNFFGCMIYESYFSSFSSYYMLFIYND